MDANCVMRQAAGTVCSNVTGLPDDDDEVDAPEDDDADSPFVPEPVVELVHANSAATPPSTPSHLEIERNRIMTPPPI